MSIASRHKHFMSQRVRVAVVHFCRAGGELHDVRLAWAHFTDIEPFSEHHYYISFKNVVLSIAACSGDTI